MMGVKNDLESGHRTKEAPIYSIAIDNEGQIKRVQLREKSKQQNKKGP